MEMILRMRPISDAWNTSYQARVMSTDTTERERGETNSSLLSSIR
jgi:hypothetical protein